MLTCARPVIISQSLRNHMSFDYADLKGLVFLISSIPFGSYTLPQDCLSTEGKGFDGYISFRYQSSNILLSFF